MKEEKPAIESATQYIDTNASEDLSKSPTETIKPEAVDVADTVDVETGKP